DLPALGHVFGGIAHVVAVEGVPQPILEHRIDELARPHLDSVPQMDAVRRLAHALLPAGDDDIAVAVADRLIAERHRSEARSAELIDPVRGRFVRDARGDRSLPRGVLPFSGREDLAQYDLAHLARIDTGTLEHLDDGDLAQFVRGQARQSAAKGSHGGTGGAGDDDLGHKSSPRGPEDEYGAGPRL